MCWGMARKLKSVPNDNFFYYPSTEVTYMTLCGGGGGRAGIPLFTHTEKSSYKQLYSQAGSFSSSLRSCPLVSWSALCNSGITFILMCFVHILGRGNAHTKATQHRNWQQCYQQEFGFRIKNDSSYILAAEKQHTAILIPWWYQESKNSDM